MSEKICVKNLSFYYGDFKALENINMYIEEKCVTSLIGPSGCGKSTFLRTINRMNDTIENAHSEGSVFINNEDILLTLM